MNARTVCDSTDEADVDSVAMVLSGTAKALIRSGALGTWSPPMRTGRLR